MRTIDKTVSRLAEEVDYWKERCQLAEETLSIERAERAQELNERLEIAQRGVGQALRFMLAITDNPDGSLSISAENRKELAGTFK